MGIELIQDNLLGFQDFLTLDGLNHHVVASSVWIAQTYKDDLFSNIGQAWANFIQTGQVWALVIGFVVGYIFRSITSY